MKKCKRVCLILLFLLCVSGAVMSVASQPVSVQAATVKSGLKKENGKYYYYVNGKKVTNTWKTVKTEKNGQTVSYRYYFGKDGAAYAGKTEYGVKEPSIRKIQDVLYGFDVYGRMIKGTCFAKSRFYVFNSKTGKYDETKTIKLRKASAYEKDSTDLRKLLLAYAGKPKKEVKTDSCYGDGKDITAYYDRFMVGYFKASSGKEIVLGISAR